MSQYQACRRYQPSPAAPRSALQGHASDIEWLEHHWLHVMSFGDVSDAASKAAFEGGYHRLVLQAERLGMPSSHDDVTGWAEQYLTDMAMTPAFTPGTQAYRARHVAMLWSPATIAHMVGLVALLAVCVLLLVATSHAAVRP